MQKTWPCPGHQKRVQWNRTPFCRRPPLWCDQHIFDYSHTQELWVLKETQKPTFDWIKRRDVRLLFLQIQNEWGIVGAAAPVIEGADMLNDTVVLVCKCTAVGAHCHQTASHCWGDNENIEKWHDNHYCFLQQAYKNEEETGLYSSHPLFIKHGTTPCHHPLNSNNQTIISPFFFPLRFHQLSFLCLAGYCHLFSAWHRLKHKNIS